jgi:hypothetical protein
VEGNVTDPVNPTTWERGGCPTATSITRIHGDWTQVNYRLAEIVRGKVLCVHADTGELVECRFSKTSGAWAEGPDGHYAAVGQAITSDGQAGGEYIVAARIRHDRSVPCIDLRHHLRDIVGTPTGCELSVGAVREVLLSASNASGQPLQHYCSMDVLTSSHPHPDGAELVGSDAGPTFRYRGRGAAFNDINGHEADESGAYLKGTQFIHVIYTGEYETLASKRPASNGRWPAGPNPNSPIVWRPVSPYLRFGSPLVASGGCP